MSSRWGQWRYPQNELPQQDFQASLSAREGIQFNVQSCRALVQIAAAMLDKAIGAAQQEVLGR